MPFQQPSSGFRVPGPYDSELAAIARREKMAQIMQQQALQPLEINSYQGIQAPISPLQGIAKVLQMYAGMNASDRGDEARAGIAKKMESDTQVQLARLLGSPGSAAIPATPATMGTPEILGTPASSFTPMSLDFEDNPNLKLSTGEMPQAGQPFAPPGDVVVPAVATIPAVAGMPAQPGRPAQLPRQPTEEEQRKIYSDFIVSGNPRLAKLGEMGLLDLRSSGTTDIKNWKASNSGLPFDQWLANQNAQKANRVSVNVSTEKTYGEKFAGGIADDDVKLRAIANKTPSQIQNIEGQRELLNSGNVFTGKGADWQNELASWATSLGIGGTTTAEKVRNTTALYADRATSTLDAISTAGLGTGQGFTDKDLKFLKDAKLGNITYTKENLQRQLDIEERVAREVAGRWNTRLGELPKSATGPTGVTPVNLPQSRAQANQPPAGVTQQQWNAMTPDQRKLWQ
jgi:hypothetical protein